VVPKVVAQDQGSGVGLRRATGITGASGEGGGSGTRGADNNPRGPAPAFSQAMHAPYELQAHRDANIRRPRCLLGR